MPEPVGGRTGVGAGGRPWRCREEGLPGWPHLIKQGDVEGEPEAVLERDLVGQRISELLGRGRRVRQQRLGAGRIHRGDGVALVVDCDVAHYETPPL